MTEAKELYDKVIKNDFCIGCGACASLNNSPFGIKFNKYGNLVAYPVSSLDESDTKVLDICPFSDKAKNEDEISEIVFPDVSDKDRRIGKYIKCYAGHVNEGVFRKKGSSGGMAKWLGYTLLKENKIDFFVHVTSNNSSNPDNALFDYSIISASEEVIQGSKSSYYPVSLDTVLEQIKKTDGRYAITGVPCMIKSIRLLTMQDPILKSRIKYTMGIVCGGMKSANHSKIIGWQLGVRPEDLVAIDFRRKHSSMPASVKLYEVWSKADKKERFEDSSCILGTDWNGSFRPYVCDYCDDVLAETADISFGDAWLPQYVNDPSGTSIIVVRNKAIHDIILKHLKEETISLDEISAQDVAVSQAGGLRQRREALSYRLGKKEKKGEYYPVKRIAPNEFSISRKRKKIYTLREHIALESEISGSKAIQEDNLDIFLKHMKPFYKKSIRLHQGILPVRLLKKVKRKLKKYLG